MRHLFIMVVAGLCYLFLLPSTGQAQELNDCSVLQDISESPYKEDICALYSQGIMSANNGSAFNPSANVTLKEEIDIIKVSNQWRVIQAYYSIYSAGEAVVYVLVPLSVVKL